MNDNDKLRVIFVSSELTPYAKTGGLADVTSDLPRALVRLGNVEVWNVIPKYDFIYDSAYGLKMLDVPIKFSISGMPYEAGIKYIDFEDGRRHIFIEHNAILGRRDIYGYHDDGYRFAFLDRAAIELSRTLRFKPDIFHCHDWHAGLLPVYLKTIYRFDLFFNNTATVFTIHNLGYQGIFSKELLPYLEISWEEFKVEKLEYWDNINFLKAGISYSDVVNTVSKQYSLEIQTPEYGETLDGLLRSRRHRLYGIVNGIDYDVWNPATDKAIARNYNVSRVDDRIYNKLSLQEELGFPQDPMIPLAGVVTRLSYQKGLDLISNILPELVGMGVQFVLLGTGDRYYENLFRELEGTFPNNIRAKITFDDSLARRIYAGADMFLMPSRYEPCGLTQLIAMRYGSIPIVRRTGGLADTVEEYDITTGRGTGFCFQDSNPNALLATIKKALNLFYDKGTWKQIIINAMKADFSWERSAKEYLELYREAIRVHNESQ